MNTWNGFPRKKVSVLSLLLLTVLCFSNAHAQYTTLLSSQGFTSNALPSGWSANWGTDNQASGYWFWSSTGNGGSNGSAMDDIWDYDYTPLSTPSINASTYAHGSDSIWVDFDFFWEYNGYCLSNTNDEINIDANSDVLVTGTEANLYTYYNTSDYNYDVAQASSSYWKHYHILIPVADRTSNMTISWAFITGQGISDIAVDNVTITGYFVVAPELSLSPKSMNFGTAAPGVTDTLFATVKSVGAPGTSIKINSTGFTGSNAYSIVSGPPVGTLIPQGSQVQYGIQFQPFTSGTLNGTFTLATTGADSGTQQISLTGIGAVPDVSYSTTNMFRGVNTEVTDTSGTQYLYVNSTGVGPLAITSVSFYGLDARAYIITHQPAAAIPAGGVDSIGVRFVPDLEGLPDAHMVIKSNAGNIPLDTVSLFGVGILPHLAIDSGKSYPLPLTINFDSVNLGSQSCQQVQLWNPGSDTLAITKNYFESADFDFSLTPISGTDTLIAPGNYKNVLICFTPLQQGTRVATLRIRTNIPHTLTTPQRDTSSFVVNVVGVGVPHGMPSLWVYGGMLNHDTLAVGVQSCEVDTVRNLGTGILTVDSIVNLAPIGYTFTFPAFPFVVPPGSSQTFTTCVTLTDTGVFNGGGCGQAGCAAVNIVSTELGGNFRLPLTVYGTKIGDTAFVSQPFSGACGSDTEQILVMNTENAPEAYTASISGGGNPGDFKVLTPTTSPIESAGGIATFNVVFTPSTTATETANFNVAGGVSLTIPLSVKGSAATIGGEGTAATATPSAPAEQFLDTVMNTGTCTWTPGLPTLADNIDFTYVSGATTPIPAGGTGLLTFMFNPPATAGQYSSNVAFSNSGGLATNVSNTVYGTVAESGVQSVAASNGYSLEQNYPNPFSGSTQLEITLPTEGIVHLDIVDVQGQVAETVLNQHFDAGTFGVTMKAGGLASGTYYYQMKAGDVTLTRQMVLLK